MRDPVVSPSSGLCAKESTINGDLENLLNQGEELLSIVNRIEDVVFGDGIAKSGDPNKEEMPYSIESKISLLQYRIRYALDTLERVLRRVE